MNPFRTVPAVFAALTLALALPLTGCKADEEQPDIMKAAAAISAVAAKRPLTQEESDAIWKAIEDAVASSETPLRKSVPDGE